jgi:hypothetical protein
VLLVAYNPIVDEVVPPGWYVPANLAFAAAMVGIVPLMSASSGSMLDLLPPRQSTSLGRDRRSRAVDARLWEDVFSS